MTEFTPDNNGIDAADLPLEEVVAGFRDLRLAEIEQTIHDPELRDLATSITFLSADLVLNPDQPERVQDLRNKQAVYDFLEKRKQELDQS